MLKHQLITFNNTFRYKIHYADINQINNNNI